MGGELICLCVWADKWIGGLILGRNGCMDGWIDRWLDQLIHGWMDVVNIYGWMNG